MQDLARVPSASNYSFSGDQRYLMQEEESKLSPSPSPGDDSESGSFLNFRIKLQPMEDNGGYEGQDNIAQTDGDYLHTITEMSSPAIGFDRYSPDNPFHPQEMIQINTTSSKQSSSKLWKDDDLGNSPENVVPKIFVTRNSQEAITSSQE